MAQPKVPADPIVGDIAAFLETALDQLSLDPPALGRRGRPRVLPAVCLWGGLLVCVLQGFSSQLALWRKLTQTGLWHYPRVALSDQAVYHRLLRDGTAPLERLFRQLSTVLADRLDPYRAQLGPELAPFATDVVVLDETTLDPVARRLPTADGTRPPSRRLPGKVALVFDVRRQACRTFHLIPDAHQNEKVAARDLLTDLTPGTLVLADLGYFGFAWFDELTERGLWWVSRLRAKTSYEVVHIFSQCGETLDVLVWLGAYRADRAKHLVRLVQYRHGQDLHQYVTNVRDPQCLTLRAIVELYARRWDIELAFRLVKQHLKLSLLWSTKDVVIQQQLIAVLIIAQILHALQLEIALRAGVDVFDVSLALLVVYAPQFAAQGEDPVSAFVARGRAAGFIRPSRRKRYLVPDPPLAAAEPLASAIPILRIPRYAGRRCTTEAA